MARSSETNRKNKAGRKKPPGQKPAYGQFYIKIAGPKKLHEFNCKIHHSANQNQLRLGEEFYLKNSVAHKAPGCPNYELELIDLKWPETENSKVHLHKTKDGAWFVCYTKRIATLGAAKNIFKMWATGAIYTMLTGEDFGKPFSRFSENYDDFLKFMAADHNITISEFKMHPAE